MKKVRTVTPVAKGDPLPPARMVVGVSLNGRAKAYPFPRLREQSPVLDTLGGVPIVLVVGDDQKSIRVFETHARRTEARAPGQGRRPTAAAPRRGDGERVGLQRARRSAAPWPAASSPR